MKKFRNLFAVLIVAGALSAVGTYALGETSYTYSNQTLKILKGSTNFTPAQIKIDRTVGQSYYNKTNINSCTKNENTISIDLICVGQDSPEKKIASKKTATWNNEEAKICTRYSVKANNAVLSPCTSTHTGTWYHN